MQADEALRSLDGGLRLVGAVVRVDQLELGLLSVFAEGVARLQGLQRLYRKIKVAGVEKALRLLVDLLLAAVCGEFILVAVAGATE
jgi:hypothetical protein